MERVEERDLVFKFRQAKEEKDRLDLLLKDAKKEFDKAESVLLELMDANSEEASAKYEGIGYVRMNKPKLYANCNVGDVPKLLEHLKQIDREDLIKTSVHPGTLSTYIKECIESGEEIPEFVSYYLKTSLRLYK